MKNRLVTIPSTKTILKPCEGFAKKDLSHWKVDLLGLCGFGCRYCSSNMGNYLRINQKRFADLTEYQLGIRTLPSDDPSLMFVYQDVIEVLERDLHRKSRSWGEGKTLMFSMLTDGFSPWLVGNGITKAALELLLDRTSFRIRVLTKNAVVGSDSWIEFFQKHHDRFVVGLSCGTVDDDWANRIEVGASSPSARLAALRSLQDAGVSTYGMMCPIFPDVLGEGKLNALIDAIRPDKCEHVWAEPYNDRQNWEVVRDGYVPGSPGWDWMTRCFEENEPGAWSEYATKLYKRLRLRSEAEGWLPKLRFLLYEHGIEAEHARQYCSLRGLMLQSPGDKDGLSKNPAFRKLQEQIDPLDVWDRLGSDDDPFDPS